MNQRQEPDSESNQIRLTLRVLIDKLDKYSDQEINPELELIELKAGEVLFEQGDEGDSMYVLAAGVLGVRVRQPDGTESVIDKLAPGATVGELALLSGQRRSATVYAVNGAGLIRLTKSKFEQLTPDEQSELVDMDTTVVARWQRLELVSVLRNLFGDLDAESLQRLQDQLEWQHLSNGDVLFRQGDIAGGMYIVVNGRLRATATTPQEEHKFICDIGPGELVGEFALLTNVVRSVTVHVVRETNLVKITPAVFERLVRNDSEVMQNLARLIMERR